MDPWSALVEPSSRPLASAGLVGLVLTAMGVAVVVRGLRTIVRARQRARDAARWEVTGQVTTGTVVDNRVYSGNRGRRSFAPVVAFSSGGREVRVEADLRARRSWIVGRSARVVLDPAEPERAIVHVEGERLPSIGSGMAQLLPGVVLLGFVYWFIGFPQLSP